MKQSGNYLSMVNPMLAWSGFALASTRMLITSAQVIGHRTGRMVRAGASPDLRDRREFALMGKEKVAAGVESAQAMTHGAFGLGQQLAVMMFRQMLTGMPLMMSLATSATPHQSAVRQAKLVRAGLANTAEATSRISTAMPRIAHKGLRPIHSRAAANRKRLAKG